MKHVLALLMLVSGSAFAADNGSEYMWQTPADKWEVTPSLSMMKTTTKPKAAGAQDIEMSATTISVKGEYGISEQFSAGLLLANVSGKAEQGATSIDVKGMADIIAFFHGRNAMGTGSLRYGVDVGLGLSKREIESTGDTNVSSGGISLTPFVGYEIAAAPCTYGARLAYKMYAGERKQTDNTSTPADDDKITGPTTTSLAFFYEHDMAPVRLGAALEIASNTESEIKTNGGAGVKQGDGETTMGIKLYVPYTVNEMITILPEFTYAQATAKENNTIDSKSGWNLGVGGRFTF